MEKGEFYGNLAFYYDFICEDRKKDVQILRKLIKKHKKSKGKKLTGGRSNESNNRFIESAGFSKTNSYWHNDICIVGLCWRLPAVTGWEPTTLARISGVSCFMVPGHPW